MVAHFDHLPRYEQTDFHVYISQLRRFVLGSQSNAAEYFFLDPSRISRYENSSELDEAPVGYLAHLGVLISQRLKNSQAVQECFLIDLNAALLEHRGHMPFGNWEMLQQKAYEYLEQQHSEHADKQTVTLLSEELPEDEQISLLKKRIGRATYYELIGMEQNEFELYKLLTNQQSPWIIIVTGLGGIGKTSLAHKVVSQAIDNQAFGDIGWINIEQNNKNFKSWRHPTGYSVLSSEDVFDRLLLQIAPAAHRSAATANLDQFNLLQTRFQKIPHLIVIDNIEIQSDLASLVSQLRDLVNPTKFLLTSRVRLHREPNVYYLQMSGLNKASAVELLNREAKFHRGKHLQYEGDDVKIQTENIYRIAGGNPLVLRLIAIQARTSPIKDVLASLSQLSGSENEELFRFVFQKVWHQIKEVDQTVFLSLLLAPHKGATREYLASIIKVSPAFVGKVLERLESLNLINVTLSSTNGTRYSIHNITRTYLQNVAHESNKLPLVKKQVVNAIRYLERCIRQAKYVLTFEEQELALHALQYALNDLLLWSFAKEFTLLVAPKMEQAGLRDRWIPYLLRSIRLSRHSRDLSTEAELRYHLGTLHQRKGHYQLAINELSQSIVLYGKLGQPLDQAQALSHKAYALRLEHRLNDAEYQANQALKILSENEPEQAYTLLVIGTIRLDQEDYTEAAKFFQRALHIWKTQNHKRMIAWCLTNLGAALQPLERYSEATSVYQDAIEYFAKVQDPIHLAVAQMNLGNVYLSQDNAEDALDWYEKANTVFIEVQDLLRLAQIHTNMGLAYYQLGQWENAERFCQLCIEEYEELGITERVANGFDALGLTQINQKRHQDAIKSFQSGLEKLDAAEDGENHHLLRKELNVHLSEALSTDGTNK